MTESFSVKADNYVSKYKYLSSTLLHFHRVHRLDKVLVDIDVLPNFWTLAIGKINPGQLMVPGKKESIEISGSKAVFIPPFSPVKWIVSPGVLEFQAFLSTAQLPSDMPKQAILFDWPYSNLPQSEDEIYQILRNPKNSHFIYPAGKFSKTAFNTKKIIDENYHKRWSISDLAKQLNISHSFLTRNFKATYGVSPLEYRTKLRLFDAQVLLLLKKFKVSTVVYASGFSDPGRFLKQFRQLFRARPSQFKLGEAKPLENSLY